MKKNNKINLFVLLMLTSFIANAMQPDSSTPKRVLAESKQKNESPITTAKHLIDSVKNSNKKRSKEEMCSEAINQLCTACPGASPNKRRRIAEVTEKAQETIAKTILKINVSTSHTEFQRVLRQNLQGHWAKEQYTRISRDQALSPHAIHPMEIDHILDGNRTGGGHFLRTPEALAHFRGAPGSTIEKNIITGVLYGPNKKSAINIFDGKLDEDVIIDAIQDTARHPYMMRILQQQNSEVLEALALGITHQGFPLELYLQNGSIQTAYPIFSFVQWQPNQASIIVAPIEINLINRSIIASSSDLEILANHAIGIANNAAIRYIDRQKIIIDLAEYFHREGLTDIVRGIYVEFPLNLFNINTLQSNFSEFFHP